ncbi:MAG: SDR family oxidoreductase [Acidobacteriota bacterium]|nr:SDR family oxidoreductase [Acidobacteriota bacterium]
MNKYESLTNRLRRNPATWLITGTAGFIGSNLLETLLKLDQRVVGLDDFSTGYARNLEEVRSLVTPEQWRRFRFVQGDLRDLAVCRDVCAAVDYVLHQAARGSVSRSIADPITSHQVNVDGFINILFAACSAKVCRFVYASSSSVYGDAPELPKVEEKTGRPLSPYAATKLVNEVYGDVFARTYGVEVIGLRYFNVFGPRQDPAGPYAAVIPQWFHGLLSGAPIYVNGDGETSRDFCYVNNAVYANILAAMAGPLAANQVYNIAAGQRTTLNELFAAIRTQLAEMGVKIEERKPVYRDFRPGDFHHSLADIHKAERLLGYVPLTMLREGLQQTAAWYVSAPTAVSTASRL